MISQKTVFGTNQQTIDFAKLEESVKPEEIKPEENIDELQRQQLKHLLIGSPKVVNSTIHYLQLIGYAQVGDWSPLLPSPSNPDEVMSILVRSIKVQ